MPAWWVLVPIALYLLVAVADDVRWQARVGSPGGVALVVGGPVALVVCLVALVTRRPRVGAFAAGVTAVLSLVTWHLPLGALAALALFVAAGVRADVPLLVAGGLGALAWGVAAGVLVPAVVPALVWLALPAFAAAGALGWLIGSVRRRHRAAEARVAALEELAAGARERERALLARELHDVVAHDLTVIAMQAAVMRVTDDPQRVEAARDAVERTSREALDELQRLLLVLRTGSGDAAAVPLDRLVDTLADQLRALGHRVTTSCDAPDLPRSVELAADRVLREAVTNIVKHAGRGVTCEIAVGRAQGSVRVEVANSLGSPAGGLPSGHSGVAGLAERLRDVGGDVTAGPEGERWVVRARLPLA